MYVHVQDVVQIFLWFKNFQTSIILFPFVSDSLPKSKAKEKKNLNHNIHLQLQFK